MEDIPVTMPPPPPVPYITKVDDEGLHLCHWDCRLHHRAGWNPEGNPTTASHGFARVSRADENMWNSARFLKGHLPGWNCESLSLTNLWPGRPNAECLGQSSGCPYMKLERPETFGGEGYCKMAKADH